MGKYINTHTRIKWDERNSIKSKRELGLNTLIKWDGPTGLILSPKDAKEFTTKQS